MDLNGDGHQDILSGTYSRDEQPMAGTFQVLWGSPTGFKPAETLKGSDGQPLIIGAPKSWTNENLTDRICTRPFAVDWTGDGILDLVCGNFTGTFHLFKGERAGVFAPLSVPLNAGDKPLLVEKHSDPFVVDWDGDGDLDILSGSARGGVHWSENKGTAKAPQPAAFVELIAPNPRAKMLSEDKLTGPTGDTRVWASDIDGDGKLDLLVGDDVSVIPAGVNAEELKARSQAWQTRLEELYKLRNEATAAGKQDERVRLTEEIVAHQKKRETVERSTGFVWLYRRL